MANLYIFMAIQTQHSLFYALENIRVVLEIKKNSLNGQFLHEQALHGELA